MRSSSEDPLDIIGTVVDARYRVIRLADEGGFSAVYQAEHLVWKQPVALKIFTVFDDTSPTVREQLLSGFVREGKLMSELSSRTAAIVQARDVGRLERRDGDWLPYLVLEWVEGAPLDVVLAREGRAELPPRDLSDAMRLLEPVAAALDIAHRRSIAHRDLKPSNIIVVNDPRDDDIVVKLLDFGIAKVMADNTKLQEALKRTGQQITAFTPSHGAPEQFSRDYGATGPWTDVFAMALILVEVLRGGATALEGESFFELGLRSCDRDRRPTPRRFGVPISPQAEAVFAKALAVSPADRHESMGEMWRSLHRVVHPDQDTWRSTRETQEDIAMLATELAPPTPPSVQPRSGGAAAQGSAPVSSVTDSRVGAPASTTASLGGVSHTSPSARAEATSSLPATSASVVRTRRGRMMLGAAAAGVVIAVAALAIMRAPAKAQHHQAALATGARAAPAVASNTAAAGAMLPSGKPMAHGGPCPAGMKLVTGGSFTMGSDDAAFAMWRPAHQVTVDTFCLEVHEVTVGAYQRCVKGGQCKPAASRPSYPKGKQSEEAYQQEIAAYAELCNGDKSGRDEHPINCVDWYQADGYCRAQGARLPTEAEWERAARGTDGRRYPWGDDPGDQHYMNAGGLEWKAWREARGLSLLGGVMYQAEDGYVGTAPVGSFPRAVTPSGQLDMIGNVWEWTADWFAVYGDAHAVNPKGPAAGDRKAIRGGGFNGAFALWMNPAFRYHQLATASSHALGFRCAADVASAD